MSSALTDIRVEAKVAEAQLIESGGSVVTQVSSGQVNELETLHWTQQGDSSLATREKFAERLKLRHAPRVQEVLHAFWTAAVRSQGGSASAELFSFTLLDAKLGFEGFHALFTRVYAALLDDYDAEEAAGSIFDDFIADAKGNDHLTNSEMGDSLFELADYWVGSIDATDYADFLWRLCKPSKLSRLAYDLFSSFLPPASAAAASSETSCAIWQADPLSPFGLCTDRHVCSGEGIWREQHRCVYDASLAVTNDEYDDAYSDDDETQGGAPASTPSEERRTLHSSRQAARNERGESRSTGAGVDDRKDVRLGDERPARAVGGQHLSAPLQAAQSPEGASFHSPTKVAHVEGNDSDNQRQRRSGRRMMGVHAKKRRGAAVRIQAASRAGRARQVAAERKAAACSLQNARRCQLARREASKRRQLLLVSPTDGVDGVARSRSPVKSSPSKHSAIRCHPWHGLGGTTHLSALPLAGSALRSSKAGSSALGTRASHVSQLRSQAEAAGGTSCSYSRPASSEVGMTRLGGALPTSTRPSTGESTLWHAEWPPRLALAPPPPEIDDDNGKEDTFLSGARAGESSGGDRARRSLSRQTLKSARANAKDAQRITNCGKGDARPPSTRTSSLMTSPNAPWPPRMSPLPVPVSPAYTDEGARTGGGPEEASQDAFTSHSRTRGARLSRIGTPNAMQPFVPSDPEAGGGLRPPGPAALLAPLAAMEVAAAACDDSRGTCDTSTPSPSSSRPTAGSPLALLAAAPGPYPSHLPSPAERATTPLQGAIRRAGSPPTSINGAYVPTGAPPQPEPAFAFYGQRTLTPAAPVRRRPTTPWDMRSPSTRPSVTGLIPWGKQQAVYRGALYTPSRRLPTASSTASLSLRSPERHGRQLLAPPSGNRSEGILHYTRSSSAVSDLSRHPRYAARSPSPPRVYSSTFSPTDAQVAHHFHGTFHHPRHSPRRELAAPRGLVNLQRAVDLEPPARARRRKREKWGYPRLRCSTSGDAVVFGL